MTQRSCGFTIIELIIVIAIIAILAAMAIPRFINLSNNAQQATTIAIAGALNAANAANYAVRSVYPTLGQAVSNCTDVPNLLQGGLPSGYTTNAIYISPGDTSYGCSVTGPSGPSANFAATGVL